MNLFIVGWRPPGGVDSSRGGKALESLLDALPFFPPGRAVTWDAPSGRATLSSVAHEPERIGGVSYVDADEGGFGLFSGRPFRWTAGGGADGRGPLDPRLYRQPAADWAPSLDGRCTAVRCDDERGELELYTDPLGSYPLYSGESGGTRWFSNSSALIRQALGEVTLDTATIACVLGAGATLEGNPVWSGVRRLPRGTVVRLDTEGAETATGLLALEGLASLPGRGLDPGAAAASLVAATGALADWPGRPVLLQLSGGRDSRLVLAAALEAGVEFEAVSTGGADHPDVRAARTLCEQVGRPHRRIELDPADDVAGRAADAARIIGATSGGGFSLEYAAGYPLEQSTGPLPLWLGGQGGEIARGVYGRHAAGPDADLSLRISRRLLSSTRLLAGEGEAEVKSIVAGAVDELRGAGAAPQDVPDLFFLQRMATWAGVGFGSVEYGKGDSISPLWTRGMLGHQLGAPRGERQSEGFPIGTLEALAPELAGLPYVVPLPRRGNAPGFAAVRDLAARAAAECSAHPAWRVLDRGKVEELLAADPAGFADPEVRGIWRLVSVLARDEFPVPA